MKLVILLSLAFLWSPLSLAVEAKAVNASASLEEILQTNCPWIKAQDVAKVKIMDPQDIGTVGGALGNMLGKLGKKMGTQINTTGLNVNIPSGVRAILFDVAFYTNANNAELLFSDLHVIDDQGNQWSPGSAVNILQSESQTLLICFVNGEHPVVMSTTVSTQNVDGSRPTIGVSVLQSVVAADLQ